MFVTLVLVAVYAGLVLLPVVLSFIGPEAYGTNHKVEPIMEIAMGKRANDNSEANGTPVPVAQVMSIKN